MKYLLVIIGMFFAGMVAAQSKYESAMGRGLEQLKAAKTAEDMSTASAFFERVGDAEKDKWLPYYYAAYANHLTGWMNPKADKDKVSEKTKDLISKAEALEKQFRIILPAPDGAIQQMTVDAMTRYQSYGAEARNCIG
jgi:DNA-binding ferritin-like protein